MNPSAPPPPHLQSLPWLKHHKGRPGPHHHHRCHPTSLPHLLKHHQSPPGLLKHHQSLPRLPKHNQSLPRLQRPCRRRGKALLRSLRPSRVTTTTKDRLKPPTSPRLRTSPNSRRKMLRTRRPARLPETVHCASRGRPTRSSQTPQQAPPLPGRQTPTPPTPRAL